MKKAIRSRAVIIAIAAILAVSSTVNAQPIPAAAIGSVAATRLLATSAQSITDIDAPSNGASVSGTVTISGWVLNSSGISRVDIYAWDSAGKAHSLGSVSGSALTARPDVQKAFSSYGALNSGYSLPVNTKSLKAGSYTLAVAGIGKNGAVQWASRPIQIGSEPLTDIDAPASGAEEDGSFTVSGWALNHDGISRVDVYAWDSQGKAHSLGSVSGSALTARPDVQKAFSSYGALNSGYRLSVDAKLLPAGKYTLSVAGIGYDGDVQWASKSITIGPEPLTDIDAPSTHVTGSTLTVSGWALNRSGINHVDVYAWDSQGKAHSLGSVSGSALTARPDVQKAFSSYGALNSGYSLSANISSLRSGAYTLAVAGIGNDGSVQWASKSITIGTVSAAPITDIDTPDITYTGIVNVTGWALNGSGISRVDIYADPGSANQTWLGSVPAGALGARPDVQKAFPAYGILNSGYSLAVPAGKLSAGRHVIAVAGIGDDGAVQWATRGITVRTIANFQGTDEVKVYTDEITGIQQTVHFQGVGAGYREVAGGYADVNTTTAMGAVHFGLATATLTSANGTNQSEGTAVTKDGSDGGAFTFSNLVVGTYTVQLTAHDGTVVARYHFTVDSNGNVE